MTKFIVVGVSIVAFFAIIEQRTGFNLFDHLRSVLPFLQFQGSITASRFGLIRAAGSADHPIALGVLFAMCIPLGVALARSLSRVWWIPTFMTLIGDHGDRVAHADPGTRGRRGRAPLAPSA